MTLQKVSHSEAESYLSCRRKHYYGYIKNGGLKPKMSATGLSRGSFVHALLEEYYNVILAAGNTSKQQRGARKDAAAAAQAKYDALIASGEYKEAEQTGRRSVKEMIFDFYIPNEPIVSAGNVVLAVEISISLEIELEEDTIYQYPFVIDLLIETPSGKTVVVDHKCLYDFYSTEDTDLLSQLPKYLAALRAGDLPSDSAAYNMIRNRSKKDAKPEDVLRYLPVSPSATAVNDVFAEQIAVASDIIGVKELSEEDASRTAYRSASSITCRNCDFRDICISERVGADIGPALALDFTVKDPDKAFEADITIK